MSVQTACFLIADISGYTRYLGGTELEHAQDILSDLLDTVVTETDGVFEVHKVEGDAVFCHGAASGATLVATIERCFFRFHQRADSIEQLSTCECAACRSVPDLDLKFVAHHGEYSTHQVAGRIEMIGPDVVVTHRLLKNSVVDRVGTTGYALLTDACLTAGDLDAAALGWEQHSESYDDIGEISGSVINLTARWREEKPRRSVRVEDPLIVVHQEVPAAPPVVWEAVTDPVRRAGWQIGTDRVDSDAPGGVSGVGTRNHCVHGKAGYDQEILDWKPFDYLSFSSTTPIGPSLWTIDLTSRGQNSTIVTFQMESAGNRAQQVAFRALKRSFRKRVTADLESLASLVETDNTRT